MTHSLGHACPAAARCPHCRQEADAVAQAGLAPWRRASRAPLSLAEPVGPVPPGAPARHLPAQPGAGLALHQAMLWTIGWLALREPVVGLHEALRPHVGHRLPQPGRHRSRHEPQLRLPPPPAPRPV